MTRDLLTDVAIHAAAILLLVPVAVGVSLLAVCMGVWRLVKDGK